MQNTSENITATQRVDSLRAPLTSQTVENMIERVNSICSIDTKEELEWVLRKVFPQNNQKIMRDFFCTHPVAWEDLLHKLHTFRKNNRENGWYIELSDMNEIYSIFLIRRRQSDIWGKLRKLLPDSISQNQELLKLASNQSSILDTWWYTYASITSNQRKSSNKKLIINGLTKNIDGCIYENISMFFPRIFPKILQYIQEIYGISLELNFCKNLDQLCLELERMFSSWNGEKRENAFRVIQWFQAWSWIEKIEEMHAQAQSFLPEFPRTLENTFRYGTKLIQIWTIQRDGNTIHKWNFIYNWKRVDVEWRVKSVKSIMHKLVETEEYTNGDAIRDMFGIALIWPDDTNTDNVESLMGTVSSLMPDYGYVMKNKCGVSPESLTAIHTTARNKWKNPLYVSNSLGATSIAIGNMSLSGFSRLGSKSNTVWCEIQGYSRSSFDAKLHDDLSYKPRWSILALMRWPKFATPKQLFDLFTTRISIEMLQKLKYTSLNNLILAQIKSGYLLPYIDTEGNTLLFTCKPKESEFIKKIPFMERCDEQNPAYTKMQNYLSNLDDNFTSFFFFKSNGKTSSPTPAQDL